MHSPRCVPTPLVTFSPYSQAALSILSQSRPPSSFDVPFLRAQLDRIESTLSTLLDQRLLLTARLSEAVALTSPIRLLSSELLSAIFIAAILPSSSSSSSSTDPPALLSTLMLVCKQWRDVCLCTPELWSRIFISPNEPDSLERARRRVIRSKVVPLDIVLDFSPRSSFGAQASQISYASKQHLQSHFPQSQPVTPDYLLKSALVLLRPTIQRWRTFTLLVPYRPQATAALQMCTSPAPLLEKLSIQVTNPMLHASSVDWGAGASTKGLIPFRGITPRLQSCSITSFWCERQAPSDELRPLATASSSPQLLSPPQIWTRMVFPGVNPSLRKLSLVGFWNDFAPDSTEMIQLLRQCPLLEELHIRNMSDIDGNGNDADFESPNNGSLSISMRYLRTLTFYYSGVTRTCALLQHIHLPSLTYLELSFLDNITSCLKYLKDQAPPLQSLRIEASLFNELKLMRLLRQIPTIINLELVDVEDVSAHLLKGMSSPVQLNEWILPSLSTLNLEGCTSVEWDDLKNLVESRLPSSSASSAARTMSTTSSSYALYTQSRHTSSASQFARTLTQTPYISQSRAHYPPMIHQPPSLTPCKIAKLDLTRCSQISRERIQWLRMYVSEVACKEDRL
ncbi:hypothetical protein Clacol_009829 [Clathrus columnatus]|uniref:F-box domain-containing protein n=1 Tax=Clathrus columnatus TaxID=1419009 RepID=A0AAV5ARX3_9AGAM|nr:hypothetical protein Clacol_009829 [Clathrus columnatus]